MFEHEYFEWMERLVCENRYSSAISYDKLLKYLHGRFFTYTIARDENRASDGVDLRYRFLYEHDYDESIYFTEDAPCSILEMMVALAIRCEEGIMDNTAFGNRTGQWFWGMIVSLGLGSMTDERFDLEFVEFVIDRFLDREYEPDGRGGLFTIKNCDIDLRTVEIWHQMCWYLDAIVY